MLGLRFFACRRCERVSAVPETPARCGACDSPSLVDITARLQADTYFSGAGAGDDERSE